MSRIQLAKEKLLEDVRGIVRELVPGGVISGRIYSARNPARNDRKAGSFVVWIAGPVVGGWRDYASDEKGDILDLVALAHGTDRKGALAWAEDRFGLRKMSHEERVALQNKSVVRREHTAKAEEKISEAKRDRARALFLRAQSGILGTPIEAYLSARGIPLRDVRHCDFSSFRFSDRMEYWLDAERDAAGRRVRCGPSFPALISAFRDARGVVGAVHVTYLARDGRGKADVAKPKLIFPACAGKVIRVAHGPSGLTPSKAAEAGVSGPVALTEGVEDAFTVALACPELRVWAAGSLPNLMSVYDHACVSVWLIIADNDWGKPQAEKLLDQAIARLKATGKPVQVIRPPAGKDINDFLNMEVSE